MQFEMEEYLLLMEDGDFISFLLVDVYEGRGILMFIFPVTVELS